MKIKEYKVFFDFDNTITLVDTLDDIIERFSVNQDWVKFEQDWKKGKIGSRECLKGQLHCVRITRADLLRYLAKIKLDKHFKALLLFLRKQGIKPVILSDNFSPLIRFILRSHGIRGLKIYANGIKFLGDRLKLSFPYQNVSCFRCGHCKKNNLLKTGFRDKIIYIGDGLSDVCPACEADIVFAKASLAKQLKKRNKRYIAFKNLGKVLTCLKKPAYRQAGRIR
ncbi:MAG: MtnX-like HAD-IB family phosphatase [Candidatus Omnitrophica bacterium]|jgi:2,3-diketo-5-methylthio-1-phosphopentane phosphatase|nr:MtnX-like HAD-IB family phosphatase [Candidatus Omnitrophota bacterium]